MIAPILTMPSFPPLCFKTSLNISSQQSPAMEELFKKVFFETIWHDQTVNLGMQQLLLPLNAQWVEKFSEGSFTVNNYRKNE